MRDRSNQSPSNSWDLMPPFPSSRATRISMSRRWLAHVQTAVQREVRSRREGSSIAGEPGDDRGDLGGFSETAHRNALDDCIEDLGAHRANHVGPDVPGRDSGNVFIVRRRLLNEPIKFNPALLAISRPNMWIFLNHETLGHSGRQCISERDGTSRRQESL